jgi:hypothetical protein
MQLQVYRGNSSAEELKRKQLYSYNAATSLWREELCRGTEKETAL